MRATSSLDIFLVIALRLFPHPPISDLNMGRAALSQPGLNRLAGWCAGQIPNPLFRLKFLKITQRFRSGNSSGLRIYGWLFGLLALSVPTSLLFLRTMIRVDPIPFLARPPKAPAMNALAEPLPNVWQVVEADDSEIYSNGLRIENRFSVSSRPRLYVAFPIDPLRANQGVRRSTPAGIVFHTTESQQAPFEAGENRHLKRIAESTLAYVRGKRAYNFLIDRFGRVYRIVAENAVASHAGYSVWSDESWLYVNLNESFLGVSFEAQTRAGQLEAAINPAQAHAAAMLTGMLRGKYGIPLGNCVTHGQVSVNASNMRIGYHTDLASGFPFEELGLPNNYAKPVPAVWAFGFDADAQFLRAAGSRMSTGVEQARRRLLADAGELNLSVAVYRQLLQRGYREKLAAVRRCSGVEPASSEQ